MARLLIVEDEWLIAAEYVALVRKAGHSVAGPFARVAQALSAIEGEGVDAAFLDVNLGGGDTSFPVAQSLQSRGIPFAFLTGYGGHGRLTAFHSAPVLSKPVTPQALLVTLGKLLPHP